MQRKLQAQMHMPYGLSFRGLFFVNVLPKIPHKTSHVAAVLLCLLQVLAYD